MADQSGERTQQPTAKRQRDARERGQLVRSRELSTAFSLAGATLALAWTGSRMMEAVGQALANGLTSVGEKARTTLEPNSIVGLLWADASILVSVVGPPALLAGCFSVVASGVQTGFAYSPKALGVHWSRISPTNGLQRFAPVQATGELVKTLIGFSAVGFLCYQLVRQSLLEAPGLMNMLPAEAARVGWNHMWALLWRGSITLAVLACIDYGLQWYRISQSLKMTKQEVKEEMRLSEGNPEIKARVRRAQREMTRRRMLQAVKKATVVITNPTHFAVALEYRRSEMAAPIVVAKGQDEMAARIRKVAREAGVPIVENVTLARALYKSAEIGDTIPGDLFGAVAEILAYLVRLKQLIL